MKKHNIIDIQAAKEGVSVQELLMKTITATDTLKEASAQLNVSYYTLRKYMGEHNIEQVTFYRVKGETQQCAS